MIAKQKAEHDMAVAMKTTSQEYFTAYYEFRLQNRLTTRSNQQFLQTKLAAEIVAAAYKSFQTVYDTHTTIAQAQYSSGSDKDLFTAAQITSNLHDGTDGELGKLGLTNKQEVARIQMASTLAATGHKWFGVAQLLLEALLASTAVQENCNLKAPLFGGCGDTTLKACWKPVNQPWGKAETDKQKLHYKTFYTETLTAKPICETLSAASTQILAVQDQRTKVQKYWTHSKPKPRQLTTSQHF